MASRPGNKRLLGASFKTTGAGLCLVLVVLASCGLLGCGGGSSSSSSSEDPSTSAEAAPSPSSTSASAKAAQDKEERSASTGGEGGAEGKGEGPRQPSGAGGAKHGPSIVQPKGEREHPPTPSEVSQATVADMTLESPSIVASSGGPGRIPAAFTCDGGGKWPTLKWGGVPAGTAELVLYVMNATPTNGKLFVDWALAGISPSLTEIREGEMPKGAIAGTNGYGKRTYEICPEGGEIYILALYALPEALSPATGFDAVEFRHQILGVSGNVGLLAAAYSR